MTDEQASAMSAELPIQDSQNTGSSNAEPAAPVESYTSSKEEVSVPTESAKPRSERTFTRDELARATAAAKQGAYEQARAEILNTQQASGMSQQGSSGDITVSPDELARVEQAVQQMYFKNQIQLAASQLSDTITEASSKYEDWDAVTSDMTDIVNPYTAPLFNQFDNAADIIYELGRNPEKIPQLAATLSNPRRAQQVLKKISDGIKSNQEAAKQTQAKAPLGQERPATVGVDNGSTTVSDLRAQDWLRG